MDESLTATDPERTIEFEFVRATENAALNVLPWLGRGEKEKRFLRRMCCTDT